MLDRHLLEAIIDISDGSFTARCPACKTVGMDDAGNHLKVYPSGAYACVINPNDSSHRKLIYTLAGDRRERNIHIKVANSGKSFSNSRRSIKESVKIKTLPLEPKKENETIFGTLGTPMYHTRPYRGEIPIINNETVIKSDNSPCNKWCGEKASQASQPKTRQILPSQPSSVLSSNPDDDHPDYRLPYDEPYVCAGVLHIPFNVEKRYRWWAGGQPFSETLLELAETNFIRTREGIKKPSFFKPETDQESNAENGAEFPTDLDDA